MQDKPVALVTGANKGIGCQTAKDLAAHRFTMLVGRVTSTTRDGREEGRSGCPLVFQFEVTNQGSIAAAAERIRNEFGFTSTSRQGVSHEGRRAVRSRRLYSRAAWESRLSTRWWRPRPHYS
jgi:NAD(P)-dependent dehydrogenase (short-subunit alcohol dehydrogenase family)